MWDLLHYILPGVRIGAYRAGMARKTKKDGVSADGKGIFFLLSVFFFLSVIPTGKRGEHYRRSVSLHRRSGGAAYV